MFFWSSGEHENSWPESGQEDASYDSISDAYDTDDTPSSKLDPHFRLTQLKVHLLQLSTPWHVAWPLMVYFYSHRRQRSNTVSKFGGFARKRWATHHPPAAYGSLLACAARSVWLPHAVCVRIVCGRICLIRALEHGTTWKF